MNTEDGVDPESSEPGGVEREIADLERAGARGDVLERARVVDRAERIILAMGHDPQPQAIARTARLRLLRARLLPGLERPQAAIDELTSLIARHGSDAFGAEVLLARALLHRAQGDSDAAEADVIRLIDAFAGSEEEPVSRTVARGRLELLEWAVSAAESTPEAEDETHWMLVLRRAQALAAQPTRGDEQLELFAARAMFFTVSAWRAIAATSETDGDASPADREGLRAGAEFFARFALTTSPEIRALIVDSETGLPELAWWSDPNLALQIAERDLDLHTAWAGRPAVFFAEAALRRASALADLGRAQEAHDQLSRVVSDSRDTDDPDVRVVVASASQRLVTLLSDTDHGDAAIRAADALAAWLDASLNEQPDRATPLSIRRSLADALSTKIAVLANRVDVGEIETLSVNGHSVDSTAPARESTALTVDEAAYATAAGELAARFARDDDPGLRNLAAKSLQNLASHQRLRGHFDQAVASYRELIRLFGDDASSDLRDDVLGPSELNLGFLLLSLLARPADAVAVYDVAIARIGEPRSNATRGLLGRLQSSRAAALTDLYDRAGGHLDAEGTGGSGGARPDPIGATERERIRDAIARGRAASDAGDHIAAIAEFNSIIDAHPMPEDRELRQRVCDAMVRTGYSLGRLKRWSESVAHHHTMLAQFGTDIDTTIEKDIALALSNLANAFDHLDRHEEEIDAYEQILARWSDSPIPELIGRCARAAWIKGFTEASLGRSADAERSYRRGMRYLAAEETATRVEACKSAVNLAIFLRKRSRSDDAAIVAERAIAALLGAEGDAAAEQRTKARMALARAESERGDVEAALRCYEWLLGDPGSTVTEEQRRTLTQEQIQLLGGPFKAAWHRIRLGRAARS
ncbi:tetratricopeptide repeat protein [Microbacteriaceae bacterium VKM Ac-2854]|nr:tetratricopeptide repeat protein [Microbacteriaceae bacterium VKM Ac-2854]